MDANDILSLLLASIGFILSAYVVTYALCASMLLLGYWPWPKAHHDAHSRLRGGMHRDDWAGARW